MRKKLYHYAKEVYCFGNLIRFQSNLNRHKRPLG